LTHKRAQEQISRHILYGGMGANQMHTRFRSAILRPIARVHGSSWFEDRRVAFASRVEDRRQPILSNGTDSSVPNAPFLPFLRRFIGDSLPSTTLCALYGADVALRP